NTYRTDGFTVAAGVHTLSFVGLLTADNTAFIDAVKLELALPTHLEDGGFETPASPFPSTADNQSFWYNAGPSDGSAWTFTAKDASTFTGSGLAANGSLFGATAAPEGNQVAFLQGQASISQTLNLAPGTYTLSFLAAQRGAQSQSFQVEINGGKVGDPIQPAGSSYQTFTTDSFTVTAGSQTVISFVGLGPTGQDNTAFI